ncbi:MAG: hypothetical protein GQF41_2941 [Candidatus Rifleibacterium amylolyticum]|nr:MAG: hypothetical protein GQF41_2941 [Candidatus Rifleibacterium amylolyticum]
MKHLEQLSEALRELTDRYGITITEVPERLREKILSKVGNEAGEDLDFIFKPLLANLLRPLRIRAGQRVDKNAVAETVKNIADMEGYDKHLAETVVDLWASVFRVNVGDFPGLADEKIARQNLHKDAAASLAAPDRTAEKPHETARSAESGRDSRRREAAHKTKAAEPSEIVVKTSFADNRETADFLSSGTPERQEKKKPKKAERLDDIKIVPLQPDMMSYSPPAAPEQTGSKKPSIDEAFRSLRNGEYQIASKIMMELARAGDTRAQYHLGEFYLMGTGVEQSNDKAKYWFRKAAAHGSLPARNKLADLEEPEGQGGCLGCAFVVFVIVVVLKFLSAVL